MHLSLASIWAILRIVYIERLHKSGKELTDKRTKSLHEEKESLQDTVKKATQRNATQRNATQLESILKDRKRKRTRIQMKGYIQSKTTTQYWTKLLQMEQQIDGQKTGVRLPGHWTRWVLPSLKTTSDLTE